MSLTPSQALEHVKEAIVGYLETAYRISHPAIYAERASLLRQRGTVAQDPFIEATPAFPTARRLAELERQHPDILPTGLTELVQHGVPVHRFPLYTHQEEALFRAFSDQPNLLVATGTGSGKTETFLLPILADILREASRWAPPDKPERGGWYDEQAGRWRHAREHERRPAAIRAIILYPMNALVNDQLARLRRILALGTSPDWQRQNLRGNVIHFGMYTSLAKPTGSWTEPWRRSAFEEYIRRVREDWQQLSDQLRESGNWPRPDSPEMLCRWDMQAAPPDILVTNYSMLEYMLVRPIEAPMFEATRRWLEETPGARLTLVLDEAHTYTGAKGTEVAYLIRRLKERLGIGTGSDSFRAIATSASIPAGADGDLLRFVSSLFDEPGNRFSLIRLGKLPAPTAKRNPSLTTMRAFARFQDTFSAQNPWPAIKQLAQDLDLGQVNRDEDPEVALHDLLETNEDVSWVRNRTARNATPLRQLADECWPNMGTAHERERATAGILAAGSFARAQPSPDTPPLLSMRIHAFFRGIAGLWACMDPNCPEAPPAPDDARTPRPVGKLYTDPRPWCECGARVLELFSCRKCGLLFLGGIPDSVQGSLWPWSDDLSGERHDLEAFCIFGVEAPHDDSEPRYRSLLTTLPCSSSDPRARPVYEVEPAIDSKTGQRLSPFPQQCPRCQNFRAPGVFGETGGREIIEPLRTRGPRSFSIVVEDSYRVQPRTATGQPPNYGRKALLFSDSRADAAQLAADLRNDHYNDLFRQLVYRVLHECPDCKGKGFRLEVAPFRIGQPRQAKSVPCSTCNGTGRTGQPRPLTFEELRSRVIEIQLERGIDPTNGAVKDFFARAESADPDCYKAAEVAFNLALRRELAEDEFALEPLGLASWVVRIEEEDIGAFPGMDQDESRAFLRIVARILATESILLPPKPLQPWKWPDDVKPYERAVLYWGQRVTENFNRRAIPYHLRPDRKLGRYVRAVARAMVANGRLPDAAAADAWVTDMHRALWDALTELNILEWAGAKVGNQVPRGIRIDSFELHPIGDTVQECESCAFVMSEALFNVCRRCGQRTRPIPASRVRSYYRRAALDALPDSLFDDPYPLRAVEHSAQIPGAELRDVERWFQDLFREDEHPNDRRVDILSVTTTMEMGIDIGSLLSVGLRNVPPTVANYQQRAGRAGRRGSAVATVLTYAQQRSHDQYYFGRPPEIVSNPPRVPTLHLANDVIARRHVHSLVLQTFFSEGLNQNSAAGLLSTWGTVKDYRAKRIDDELRAYLRKHRETLRKRCSKIVHPNLASKVGAWIDRLPGLIDAALQRGDANQDLLASLLTTGLLPKYAFPVDVVRLNMPIDVRRNGDEENDHSDAMQRDLRIALSEYAPGAEVIRGSFDETYVYRSVGLYDPFERQPNYRPTGVLLECMDCLSIDLLSLSEDPPGKCRECHSVNVEHFHYLRPPGFTVDLADPKGRRVRYQGGGRERSGYTVPARLLVGKTSFNEGKPVPGLANRLFSLVRVGDLFTCNKGPGAQAFGYPICPSCGRCLTEQELEQGWHTYPADIPPHRGNQRGPRAGDRCEERATAASFNNYVVLGHRFHSEVILLGVNLSAELDAPFKEPSGKAIWYSFGTLVAEAAVRVLQIDPGELRVGVRAANRGAGRIHGEVFIYDDVPGGAGYARAISEHLDEILNKASELSQDCPNPHCPGACYHCLLDYRNQPLHPLLDRGLGGALLDYVLKGEVPTLERASYQNAVAALEAYVRTNWQVSPEIQIGDVTIERVLEDQQGRRVGLWVIHPLLARPSDQQRLRVLSSSGIRCAVHTVFDLERRPFWVANNLL